MKRLAASVGFLVLAACASAPAAVLTAPDGARVTVTVELARTSDERQRGLMFRTALPEGHGMLFVFDAEQPLSFWMKNTLLPLDILFFDDAGMVVSSASMTPCTADPCPVSVSSGPARYALEVPAGFVERHRVAAGWTLSLRGVVERP